MTHRVKGKVQWAATVLLCLLTQAVGASSDEVPDIELLEFLGTIAGLESMGIEIDELLAGSKANADDEGSTTASASAATTDAITAVDKGEDNE